MTRRPEDTDDNVVLDAEDDDWAWRRRIRANPAPRLYRAAVAMVGAVVLVIGLIAVPAPGPGWLIVFVGLAIWASEFEFAQRLLRWGRARSRSGTRGCARSPGGWAASWGSGRPRRWPSLFWGFFAWQGTPGWLPDPVEGWLQVRPGCHGRGVTDPGADYVNAAVPRYPQGAISSPGRVAQLVRALASHARGQGFESLHVHPADLQLWPQAAVRPGSRRPLTAALTAVASKGVTTVTVTHCEDRPPDPRRSESSWLVT